MKTHDFQGERFECYTQAEFAAAGLRKTHRQVSNTFGPSEGLLLRRWLRYFPDALLVTNGRQMPRITVYAPKKQETATRRGPRLQRRCGNGDLLIEGMDGTDGNRAFYDVLAACQRKLNEWEEAGVLTLDRFDNDFTNPKPNFGPNPGSRQP